MKTLDTEIADEVDRIIRDAMNIYMSRFSENMKRVTGLVDLHVTVTELKLPGQHAQGDILRAAVVFAHASLEDLLRQIAQNFLPYADEQTLNQIPLAGAFGRAEKFALGKLSQHRGKSVDVLISESVASYLALSNFNNVADIVQLLRSVRIDPEPDDDIKEIYSALSEMMERRHQIVHRADNLEGKKRRQRALTPKEVRTWIKALFRFVSTVLTPVTTKHLVVTGVVRHQEDGMVEIHRPKKRRGRKP